MWHWLLVWGNEDGSVVEYRGGLIVWLSRERNRRIFDFPSLFTLTCCTELFLHTKINNANCFKARKIEGILTLTFLRLSHFWLTPPLFALISNIKYGYPS
jgi:hypothetical protein